MQSEIWHKMVLEAFLHIFEISPRNAKLHIFEVQVLLQIGKYLQGVVSVEWESLFLESGFMDCAFEYYAKPHPCLSPTLGAKPG